MEIVQLNAFNIEQNEDGEMIAEEIGEEEIYSEKFRETILIISSKALTKKASRSENGKSRDFVFSEEAGEEDKENLMTLLEGGKSTFKILSKNFAEKYIQRTRSRRGLFIVGLYLQTTGQTQLPFLVILKQDYKSSMSRKGGEWLLNKETIDLNLTKAIKYPIMDGANQDFERIRVFQEKREMFDRIFSILPMRTQKEIEDDSLAEVLLEESEKYQKYFTISEEDRHAKRDVNSDERLILEDDLLDPVHASTIAKKQAFIVVDEHGKRPMTKLKINDDVVLKFPSSRTGMSVIPVKGKGTNYIMINAEKAVVEGAFTPIEFCENASLKQALIIFGEIEERSSKPKEKEMEA